MIRKCVFYFSITWLIGMRFPFVYVSNARMGFKTIEPSFKHLKGQCSFSDEFRPLITSGGKVKIPQVSLEQGLCGSTCLTRPRMRCYSSLQFPVRFLTARDYELRTSHATDFPNHIGPTNDFPSSRLCLLIQLSSMREMGPEWVYLNVSSQLTDNSLTS